MGNNRKQVRASGRSDAGKQPVAASSNPDDEPIRFRFGRMDEHKWQLTKISKSDNERLLKRLAHFEKLTVGQARANSVLADYDMADCPNEQARRRLANQYDGQDSLCRLDITPSGAHRLMGIREGGQFHIIWWDPSHDIWPEGKQKR